MMKKRVLIAVILVIAVLMTACGKKKKEYTANIANPFETFETLAEAEAKAGVTLKWLPQVEGYDKMVYRAAENELLEVIYQDEKEKEGLRVRKAKGSADISGDSNEYAEQEQIVLDQFTADVKGNDGKVGLITWTETVGGENFAYSVGIGEAQIDQATAAVLVNAISEAVHTPVEEVPETTEGETIDGEEIEAGSPLAGHTFTKVSKTMKVKADLLNAREYPLDIDPNAEVATQLENGTVVDVIYETEEWSGFKYVIPAEGERLLWVKTEYLS